MSLAAPTETPVRFPIPGLGLLADLGGIAGLALKAAGSIFRRGGGPPLLGAVAGHASWMIGMGLPLVALVHLSMGSFLAMQAFFGATFTEAAGPVVGLGLLRNLAPWSPASSWRA